MGVYDGSFNTRFHLAVSGRSRKRGGGGSGGHRLPVAFLNVPMPPRKEGLKCGKTTRKRDKSS